MAELNVKNEELRTLREAMRELTALLDQLEKGDIEKVVLTSRGRMRGVLVSVDKFSELVDT